MRKMSSICDHFVIASGTSTTHVSAIADNIIAKMKLAGQRLWHVEGAREASWILLDFSDVIAHVFLEETRSFYDLERLWGNAPQMRYTEAQPRPKPRPKKRPKSTGKRRAKKTVRTIPRKKKRKSS